MNNQPSAPSGWYDDPDGGGGKRFFNGTEWTENRTPPAQVSENKDEKKQEADGIIVTGYVTAVLIPLVGFIIGLTQINKNRHGLWVVLVSIAVFILWMILIGAAADDAAYNGSSYNY